MKYSLPASFIALTLAACATSNVRVVSSDPTVAAKDFYTQLRHERIEGLPQGKQWRDLEPLMTPKLASEFREASRQQAVFLKKNPDEKAPWAEGDLFGSLFEGPQGFTVGSAVVKGEHAEVPVQLFYKDKAETVRWTDTLILQHTTKGWLLDDVRYGGKWPFAPKGTLSEVLTSEGC